MLKKNKERVVEQLTERLKNADTLFVADYRGLTNAQLEGLRDELLKHGARFSVTKNTLTRRAAEAAGQDALLTLLEGPTAIAFLESEGDMVATAKALSDLARDTRILAIRGGVLEGRAMTSEDVESLAKLPPLDVLHGQVLGAIVAPIQAFAGLVAAPLTNLVGLIDSRIKQLEEQGEAVPAEPVAEAEPAAAAEPLAEAEPVAAAEPAAEAEPLEETSPEAPAAAAEEPEAATETEEPTQEEE
jgi:large subunit ribosomal protein L10